MTQPSLVALLLVGAISFGMSYLGAAVGLVLGQLRVPLLIYVLGSASAGTATSLAVSTVGTVAGAFAHARGGRVHVPLLLTIGVPSALTAYAAAQYASHADPRLLKLIIALALAITGSNLLFFRRNRPPPLAHQLTARTPRGLIILYEILIGTVLGAVSGLVGLLLGSLRLPAMLRLTGVAPAKAVGTNMALGAITGFSAGLTALSGGKVNIFAFAIVAPLTLLGAPLGARKTAKLDETTLTKWIGYALLFTAVVMFSESTILNRPS